MIYNFNRDITWTSGGAEHAQLYRAKVFRNIRQDAKFVYTEMFTEENLQHMTKNIGFLDSEVIWLYSFFTDCKIAPTTYTLSQLEKTFGNEKFAFSRRGRVCEYIFTDKTNFYIMAYMVSNTSDCVYRVDVISNGCLLRRDFYTYCRTYSEYYAPSNKQAHLYQRRFFNEDGTVAYEEVTDNGMVVYRFPNKLLYSKDELIGYMISLLNLTEKDVIILDLALGIEQAIIENAFPAHIGVVLHSEHFGENDTDGKHFHWYGYYEYVFSQYKHISFYITATSTQNNLLREQFRQRLGVEPDVKTIPPGSLETLRRPMNTRQKHSLLTVSRLSTDKYVNRAIEAVVIARKYIADLSLDIYGDGPKKRELQELIEKLHCGDYVHLCGYQKMNEVYLKYEAYLTGSICETFGLTLMEAAGSGLPIIGYDVRYGNQNFIDDNKNGYRVMINDKMKEKERVQGLAESIIRLFKEADMEGFRQHSYEKAQIYLTEEVERRWIGLLKELT